jgi:iron complex outermembrane receptor protein
MNWACAIPLAVSSVLLASPAKAQTEEAQEDEIVVTGSRYHRNVAEGAGPLNLSIVDTPQSLSFVTRELIDDTAATNLEEIIERVSGTQKGFEITGVYRSALLRGFFAVNMDSYKEDGLTFINQIDTDLSSIERIEVIRGPASVLYGRTVPGGIINRVTKRPQDEAAYELRGEFGSYDQYRGEFDLTGPLDENGRVRYRVVGALEDRGSHIDLVSSERQYLQGTLDFDVGQDSMFRLRASVQSDEGRGDTGLPLVYSADGSEALVPDVPESKAFSFGNGLFSVDAWDASVLFTTEFDNGWRMNARAERREYTRLIIDGYIFAPSAITPQATDSVVLTDNIGDPLATLDGLPIARFLFPNAGSVVGLAQAYVSRDDLENVVTNAELNFSGGFGLFGRQHDAAFGVTYTDLVLNSGGVFPSFNVNSDPRLGFDAAVAVDIFSTDIGALQIPADAFQGIERTPIIAGEYLTIFGQVAWRPTDRLTVVTSLAQNMAQGQGFSPENTSDYEFTSPQIGVLYEVAPDVNVYASFSRGALNNDAYDQDGRPLGPSIGEQYEIGAKGTFYDGRLYAAVALFDLTRTNIAQADPACFSFPSPCVFPGASLLRGEQRHRGIEVDIVGNPTPNLSLIVSGTYLDPETTEDSDPALVGTRPPGLSEFTGSIFANYEFEEGPLAGFSIGGGPVHIGDRQGLVFSGDRNVTVPGYTRWDAVVGYDLNDHVGLTLNFENITDIQDRIRTYPDSWGNLRVTPFTVTARTRLRW